MNLEELFKMQKELDEHIQNSFPKLRNEDILDRKILALQVELGELAQNSRRHTLWSSNQKTNITTCNRCDESGMLWSKDPNTDLLEPLFECDCNNPLLEEYVDCLHFILSIGLDINANINKTSKLMSFTSNTTSQFNAVFKAIA